MPMPSNRRLAPRTVLVGSPTETRTLLPTSMILQLEVERPSMLSIPEFTPVTLNSVAVPHSERITFLALL